MLNQNLDPRLQAKTATFSDDVFDFGDLGDFVQRLGRRNRCVFCVAPA